MFFFNKQTKNMERITLSLHFRLFTAILLTLCSFQTGFSQGEWKWAHYWSGGDDSPSNYYNEIKNTAFDSEGNIYVYGTMGGDVHFDGNEFLFCDTPEVRYANVQGILLAKFDTLGNMLWNRVVKCNPYSQAAMQMVIRNDRIYIAGTAEIWGDSPWGTWQFYLDTFVRKQQINSIPVSERKPPFKIGSWSFFCQFDTDGNLIEDHFIESYSREHFYVNGVDLGRSAGAFNVSAMHIDNDGNTFLYSKIVYKGRIEDPYTIVVDGDTNRRYDIYLPGDCQAHYTLYYNDWYDTYDTGIAYSQLFQYLIYKFSPDWELMWVKQMVDHTEGLALDEQDSVNPRFYGELYGLSYDEENNMYLSGYIAPTVYWDAHQYPVRFYWDSTHCTTINDMSGVNRTHIVIKYDTAGNVLWCNQIYTRGTDNYPGYANDQWWRNLYHNNVLYLTGHGQYHHNGYAGIFFDSTFTQQLMGPNPDVDEAIIGFFVRYDAETGAFLNYGVVPAFEENSDGKPGKCPAVLNNRVFALAYYKRYLTDESLMQWRIDGHFIGYEPFNADDPALGSVIAYDNGSILCDMLSKESVTFSENVWVSCYPTNNSSAVFALYKDPAFATPYTGIPARGRLESGLRLWPNPATSVLQVSNGGTDIDYVTVLDLEGRTLLRKEAHSNALMLDVSALPSGSYLLEAVCKGQVSTAKFVKH